jgi:hypothetical protein
MAIDGGRINDIAFTKRTTKTLGFNSGAGYLARQLNNGSISMGIRHRL